MPANLIYLWAMIMRLCGLSAPTRVRQMSKNPSPKKAAGKRAPAPKARRVRLSPIDGPRKALRLIADTVGQVSGIPRQPLDPFDLQVAWLTLGDPIAGFVQATIALGLTVPMFPLGFCEEAQFQRLVIRARRSAKTFINGIRREFPIRVSLQATSLLAQHVQRLFRGSVPKPVRTNGPAGDCEWHVVDSMDRPLICRLLEHEDGRLEILDRGGGFLHRDTLKLSSWRLLEGWLLPVGFRHRAAGDGDGLPHPEPQPNPPNV